MNREVHIVNRGYVRAVNEIGEIFKKLMAQQEIVDTYADLRDNVTDGDATAAAILTLATMMYVDNQTEIAAKAAAPVVGTFGSSELPPEKQ